ncbi:MAG: DegV family protein [Clostridiales bacterium]|nr:DegV family protein [Clostridiales bacterium]
MSYRIIGDSCTDLPEFLKEDEHFKLVPLTISLDDETIVDDNTFNIKGFLSKLKSSNSYPKSACPSPQQYMEQFDFDGDIYVITLSSALSGSYNSAQLAKKLYLEKHPDKNIEVIDSRSASVGQTLLAYKIKELVEKGHSFQSVVEQVYAFRSSMKTKFVLESLEILMKNGRLTGLQAFICNTLNIKPILGATPEGTICKLDQSRGIMRALSNMAKIIEKDVVKPQERILGIAHCNNYERALFIKDEILKRIPFKDCIIVETAGISTMYANEGGIITAY